MNTAIAEIIFYIVFMVMAVNGYFQKDNLLLAIGIVLLIFTVFTLRL